MDFSALKNFMDYLTNWRIPGNTISVYHENKEIFKYSSGYNDIENKIPMRGEEIFNIYSCTKVATVVSALQLLEKGLFLIDDPLYDFIPEYREMYIKDEDGGVRKAKNPITMRHLFTMTAGLTYNTKTASVEKAKELTSGKMDTVMVAKCIADDPLSFEPGTYWQYSLCHDVLAAAVEVISGKKFGEYIKENVFNPIGVTEIYFNRNDEIFDKMASQYTYVTDCEADDIVEAQKKSGGDGSWKNVGKDIARDHRLGENYESGGAGIAVSVGDYAKFGNTLAMGGKGANGEKILSKATIDLLRQNQLDETQLKPFNWSQLRGYGYGLGVRTMVDRARGGSLSPIGEFGWGGAAGATLLVDPENQLSYFYAHHMLNPQEDYYQPRLRNVVYGCFD